MRPLIVIASFLLFSNGAQAAPSGFSGQWRVIVGCPQGYAVAVNLSQKGDKVAVTWSDLPFVDGNATGLNFIGGHEGKIKGKAIGNIASVKICSYDEASNCDFTEGGTIELIGSNLVWVNKGFEDQESSPSRSARLVLSPGSADNKTWRCQ
jgi:hypothetical protein